MAFLFTLHCQAQNREITSNSYWRTGFKQIKESANFGLVFSGATSIMAIIGKHRKTTGFSASKTKSVSAFRFQKVFRRWMFT